MVEYAGPFDTAAWAEADWAFAGRLWLPDSVNGLFVTAGGGMTSSVALGEAWVKGFGYHSDAAKALTHASSTGTAGQSRNDIVVVRMDRAANTIITTIVPGAFAVTPTDPAINRTEGNTGVWDVPIARVNVVANAAAIGTITDLRPLRNSSGLAVRTPQHIRAYRNAAWTIPSASSATIAFDTTNYDYSPWGSPMFNSATGLFTIIEDGLYDWYSKAQYAMAVAADDMRLELQNNTGTTLAVLDRQLTRGVTAGDTCSLKGFDRLSMLAGDTAKVVLLHTGAGVLTGVAGSTFTYVDLRRAN